MTSVPPSRRSTTTPPFGRASVKGAVLQSRLAFVRTERGEAAVERVLERLPDDDRVTMRGVILPFAWYSFELNDRLDKAIAYEFDIGDRIFRLLGEASARHNLASSGQAHYVRDRNPQALLKHTSAIYKVYYSSGNRVYERVTDRRAVLRTFDSSSFSASDCLTVVGWYTKAIELCGGRNVLVNETRCRTRGDTVCEYVCDWL